jgi:hypothetical protein
MCTSRRNTIRPPQRNPEQFNKRFMKTNPLAMKKTTSPRTFTSAIIESNRYGN